MHFLKAVYDDDYENGALWIIVDNSTKIQGIQMLDEQDMSAYTKTVCLDIVYLRMPMTDLGQVTCVRRQQ